MSARKDRNRRKGKDLKRWAKKALKTTPWDKNFYITTHNKNLTRRGTIKVMSNADRRRLGIKQDPDLEDFQDEQKNNNKHTERNN